MSNFLLHDLYKISNTDRFEFKIKTENLKKTHSPYILDNETNEEFYTLCSDKLIKQLNKQDRVFNKLLIYCIKNMDEYEYEDFKNFMLHDLPNFNKNKLIKMESKFYNIKKLLSDYFSVQL